jgi:uncharacterized membrane protein YuzA (DUF378 family)
MRNILIGIATVLVLVGALNWGLVGFFDKDAVKMINDMTLKNPMVPRIIYSVVGVCAVIVIIDMVMKKMQKSEEEKTQA